MAIIVSIHPYDVIGTIFLIKFDLLHDKKAELSLLVFID